MCVCVALVDGWKDMHMERGGLARVGCNVLLPRAQNMPELAGGGSAKALCQGESADEAKY